MVSDISRLVKNTPVKSLKKFFNVVHKELIKDVGWKKQDELVRKSILEIVEELDGEGLSTLNFNAERINSLTDQLGQNILKHFVNDDELDRYHQLKNEHDRALWFFLEDQARFRQVEDSWYADTKRQGRMWNGYSGPKNVEISKNPVHKDSFQENLMKEYRAVGNIKVDIYERKRPRPYGEGAEDSEEEEIDIIQIMVYREDLPTTHLAFEKSDLVPKIFRTVKEVAITYCPDSGEIEVVSEGDRDAIVKIFSETLLQAEIKGERVPLKQYDISKLLRTMAFSHDAEDYIEWVKVTMLKVGPYDNNNNVTLDVSTKEQKEIYEVSKEYFDENDPLQSGFRLKQARISIRFFPDEENRRGKTLHVKLSEPNGCDLKSKSQKERLIGEKYLERWGLVKKFE